MDAVALVSIVLGRKAGNVIPSGFVSRAERRLCYLATAFWTPLFHCRKPGLSLEANSRHEGWSQVFFCRTLVLPATVWPIVDRLLLGP